MAYNHKVILLLYNKILALYPQAFREQLGESMEQTFKDLYNEKLRTKKELFHFILSTFLETTIGIVSEHLLLIFKGAIMQGMLGSLGSSASISFLFIAPLIVLEIVNRRQFNEAFPFMLFAVLWLNLFAISLILLPIVQARRTASTSPQTNTLLTKPSSTLFASIALFLFPLIFILLDSMGWISLNRFFNGPNPEQPYLFGQILSLALISIPIGAGIIAGRPIIHTLRAGGSLFAHPAHLVIVFVILFLFTMSVAGLIADQWSCFMGVQFCD